MAQHAVSTDLGRGGHSRNDSTTRVALLPTDILRQAPLDQALLVHGTLPPAHLHARPYYRDRRLRAMAAGAGPGVAGVGAARRSWRMRSRPRPARRRGL